MYRIFFINHGYYYPAQFDTLNAALEAMYFYGFEGAVMRGTGLDETLVATWRPIDGMTWYDRDEQTKGEVSC